MPINISCATCHDPKRAGSDFTSAPNTVSIGAGWYDVNSEQTVNAAYYPLLYWNGRTDSLWAQAAQVSESGVSMNGTRLNTFWVILTTPTTARPTDALFTDTPLPDPRRRRPTFRWSASPAPGGVRRHDRRENKRMVTQVSRQLRQGDRGLRVHAGQPRLGVRRLRRRGHGLDGDLARRQARGAAVRRQGVLHRLPQRTAVLGRLVPRRRRAPGRGPRSDRRRLLRRAASRCDCSRGAREGDVPAGGRMVGPAEAVRPAGQPAIRRSTTTTSAATRRGATIDADSPAPPVLHRRRPTRR